MTAGSLESMVAAAMDAEEDLVPHLPELLQDLESLGVRGEDVVRVLRDVRLPPRSTVLDLGCGKGEVALTLAVSKGSSVLGVDATPAFVEHASLRAVALGVEERCRFVVGDLHEWLESERDYDVVAMLALGAIFGDVTEVVGKLRRCATPGGLLLLDEAYLADGVDAQELGLDDCHDRDTTISRLEAHGDHVVGSLAVDTQDHEAWYREMTARIVERADALAVRVPAVAASALAFAERQREETRDLSGPVMDALWLLRVDA